MICTVVGARPNFMKMAPIVNEARRRGIAQLFVHTGQHYDQRMSDIFFEELGMPQPDLYLGVGSGTHAEQTARVMLLFEQVLLQQRPQLVVVAGDVNSTLACALTASKLSIPVAHVEAGLRSFDRSMPEEINRVLTDHISDLLFTTEPSGRLNLLKEGIADSAIYFVGNTMIDTLCQHLEAAKKREPWRTFGLQPREFGLVTLHRPSNVDNKATSRQIASALQQIGQELPLIFPIHPRTLKNGEGLWEAIPGLKIVEPMGYLDFLGLMSQAAVVITDSGGIQEETTALQVPCVTVRPNTERPITITEGTNQLVPPITDQIVSAVKNRSVKIGNRPKLWDGKAAQRIIDVIQSYLDTKH